MSRWASSAWLALAGCNQIFGNHAVGGADAAFFDARADAASSCESVPAFSRNFVQVIPQDCYSYTLSAADGRAAAVCAEADNGRTIELGARDQMLLPDPSVTAELASIRGGVRMAADGDRITFGAYEAGSFAVAVYRRLATGWVREPDVVSAVQLQLDSVSEITLGGRILVAYGPQDVRELEDRDGSWVEVGRDRLVAPAVGGVHLSGDGLRTWDTTGTGIGLYTRPDLDSPFALAGVMPGTNGIDDAFLTEDCGALYFSALGSIWIAPRI